MSLRPLHFPAAILVGVACSGGGTPAPVVGKAPKPSTGATALLTWGELTMGSPTVVATGSLLAIAIDALARPMAAVPTRVAERLSAWHVIASSPTTAIAVLVERDAKATSNAEDAPRTA